MALSANRAPPAYDGAIGTTCTVVTPGNGVHTIEISTDSDIYLVLDDTLTDGSAVPSGKQRIAANTTYYVPVSGPKILVAAVSGTAKVSVLGLGL